MVVGWVEVPYMDIRPLPHENKSNALIRAVWRCSAVDLSSSRQDAAVQGGEVARADSQHPEEQMAGTDPALSPPGHPATRPSIWPCGWI